MTRADHKVYKSICEAEPGTGKAFITICGETEMNESDVLVSILNLEFLKKIIFIPGRYYCKNTKFNRKALGIKSLTVG